MRAIASVIPFLFTIALTMPSVAQPTPPDSLTWEDAVRLTLQNHPVIRQAEDGAAAAHARIGSNRSYSLPDLSLSGTYVRLEPVSSVALGGGPSIDLYPHDNYDFHLDLQWTLYDFNRISTNVKLAESGYQASLDNIDMAKSNLTYQTISIFNAILILRQTILVIDDQIDALKQHLDVTVRKIQAGTATDYDSLTTKVRIAVADNQRIDAVHALETQEILFRQMTGISTEVPISLKGEFAAMAPPPDLDSATAAAQNQRIELTLARDAENIATVQSQLASMGDRPILGLDLTSGFKNGYFPKLNAAKANATLGLFLQVPFFDGHRTHYKEIEAEANLSSAGDHTADLKRQIESEVKQAIAGVQSSLEKLKSSDIQIRQAEMAVQIAKNRYEAGVVTNLDLIDAETALSETRLMRLRAQYEYTVSLSALNKSTGKKLW